MAMRERIYRITDAPMTWTRAILVGLLIWIIAIAALGQIPSLIIYKFDEYIASIIDLSTRLPGVGSLCAALGSGQSASQGCNATQIALVRDLVANGVQMTALAVMLAFAYFWQEAKRKRVGGKGIQDVVKGYMSGK